MSMISKAVGYSPGCASAVIALCVLVLSSVFFADAKADSVPSDAFSLTYGDRAAGYQTFESQDFVLHSNSLGELRLDVIGIVDLPFGSRKTLRFVFDDHINEPLQLALSQSSDDTVSLTFSIPGVPALLFEKNPRESFVRHEGLLTAHSDAHFDQMLKYGIHTGRIEDFMRLSIDPELLRGMQSFAKFSADLNIEILSGSLSAAKLSEEWLQVCSDLSANPGGIVSSLNQGQGYLGDAGIQSWSCVGAFLSAAGGTLALFNSFPDCGLCALWRNQRYCSECAAITGVAVGSLIAAIDQCFGNDPEPVPPVPPAPPTGYGGPVPIPDPGGGGWWVPITTTTTVLVCIDGECVEQTITETTWVWAQP